MGNLFKKAAVFTDIHLGLKSNSTVHNEDCWAFTQWMVHKAKEEGCETCFFLGDWHNNRASINILTLNYSLKLLEFLSKNFDVVYFIPGNHDLYYRDKRDVQSVEWAKHLPNIRVINEWFSESDVIIAPWLVGDDYKKINKLNAKYCFGHFELPHFYMNAMVQMPDTGEVKREDFSNVEQVFSGHFHKRQTYKNITYIGNCFPHNYADAGDDERGLTIIEWGHPPKHYAWPNQPKYRVYSLSDVLVNTDKLLFAGLHARINLDVEINYEEATLLKQKFVEDYNMREVTLIPQKSADLSDSNQNENAVFESVDQIVTTQLLSVTSDVFDKNLLLDIYRNL